VSHHSDGAQAALTKVRLGQKTFYEEQFSLFIHSGSDRESFVDLTTGYTLS
jgi:hypothetical protein